MGGKIYIESQLGKGTSFHVHLAVGFPNTSKTQRLNSRLKSLSLTKKNILLVDNDPIFLSLASQFLATFGAQQHTAKNGQEALDKLQKQHYDYVLLDCELPVISGFECSLTIRKDMSKPQPIIIAITANATVENRDKCYQSGMNDFLAKPISMSALSSILGKWEAKTASQTF